MNKSNKYLQHPTPTAIARYARCYANKGFARSECCDNLRRIFVKRGLGGGFVSHKLSWAEGTEKLGGYERTHK